MSILISISDLKHESSVQQIQKDLLVSSIEKTNSSLFNGNGNRSQKTINKYSSKIQIEAYNLSPDYKTIYMPFSYVYHHFPKYFEQMTTRQYPSLQVTFQGSLLERQKAIRESVFEILNRTRSILLCLHTGFGKTIFTIYLLSKLKKRTLILCHRTIIIDQWVKAIRQYLPEANVGIWKANMKMEDQPEILIANASNLVKWSVERYSQYGVLVADEVHTMCTEQMSKGFSMICPSYVIGLSATPFREDGLDRLLELYIGPEMISREMKKQFNVYKVNTGFQPIVERSWDGSTDWNAILEAQAQSKERNRLIVNLVRYFSTRVILVLVKRVDHAHLLCETLRNVGESVDVFLGTTKKVNYESRILIATYSKGGVGFDHPRLDLLCCAADVESNYAQYLGRVFRRDDVSPIVLDLVDLLSTMNKHYTTRMKICKEAGGTIRKFESCFTHFTEYCNLLYL